MVIKRIFTTFIFTLLLCTICSVQLFAEEQPPKVSYSVVHKFDPDIPPQGIAFFNDKTLLVAISQHFGANNRVGKIGIGSYDSTPFPNKEWGRAPKSTGGIGLFNVAQVHIVDNIAWILDQAEKEGEPAKILGWDIVKNRFYRVFYIYPPVLTPKSLLHDFVVDTSKNVIFITDESAALIVLNTTTGHSRRVLDQDRSTISQDIPLIINGKSVKLNGKPFFAGAAPLALDLKKEWLYFGAFSGHDLYRIKVSDLINTDLSEKDLSARVAHFAKRPITGSIVFTKKGNIVLSDVAASGIGMISKDKVYKVLFKDNKKLQWIEGLLEKDDGFIYGVSTQRQGAPSFNDGVNRSTPPFLMIKFKEE